MSPFDFLLRVSLCDLENFAGCARDKDIFDGFIISRPLRLENRVGGGFRSSETLTNAHGKRRKINIK